jgi:hypothetical protein
MILERLAGAVLILNGVAVIVRGVWFSHGAIVGLWISLGVASVVAGLLLFFKSKIRPAPN